MKVLAEYTNEYYKGAKSEYESDIEAFKKQEEFFDDLPVLRCRDYKNVQKGLIFHCADGERKEGEQDD